VRAVIPSAQTVLKESKMPREQAKPYARAACCHSHVTLPWQAPWKRGYKESWLIRSQIKIAIFQLNSNGPTALFAVAFFVMAFIAIAFFAVTFLVVASSVALCASGHPDHDYASQLQSDRLK
jgi:hypothetical protein